MGGETVSSGSRERGGGERARFARAEVLPIDCLSLSGEGGFLLALASGLSYHGRVSFRGGCAGVT